MDAMNHPRDFQAGKRPWCLPTFLDAGRWRRTRDFRTLLVDNDSSTVKTITDALFDRGYSATIASSSEVGTEALRERVFDMVIVDFTMASLNGFHILKKAKEISPETIVIMLISNADVQFAINALRFGADDYLLKPCNPDVLTKRIANYLERLGPRRNGNKP